MRGAPLALLACACAASVVPRPPDAQRAQALLERIDRTKEEYRLEEYYAASRELLGDFPEHAEVDRVRYELAVQLVAANLETPTSTGADEARRWLAEHSARGRTVEQRFEADLLLLKFSPRAEHQRRGEAMLLRFPGYADLDQVYFFLVESALEGGDLPTAAGYAKRALELYPDSPEAGRMRDLIRRGRLAHMPYHAPELRPIAARFTGKVVLVDFFASWCTPCIAELPQLLAFYRAHRGPGFEILSVSLDDDPQRYAQFIAAHPLPWAVVHAQPLGAACGVTDMPTYFVVDKDGAILSTELRGRKLYQKLEALLSR